MVVSTFDVKVIGLHHAPQSTTVDGKSVDAHYDTDTGILEFKTSADASSIDIQK
jgi:hypothetical protein